MAHEHLVELRTVEDVDAFLEKNPTCALFKAGGCHKTMQGFGYVEEALQQRESIPLAFVRVIECRPASNHIAQRTGIIHQSPQFILLINRQPVYDVDNWDIIPEGLDTALNRHLGPIEPERENTLRKSLKHADTEPYKHLLREFVCGTVREEEFKEQWLTLFQRDASLRSSQEFDLLNSLFGDVDAAIHLPQHKIGSSLLKADAEELLNKLETHI